MTYLEWLSLMLMPDDRTRESYQKLFLALYNAPFNWFVKNDINRAEDGEQLRVMYENETGLWCNDYNSVSLLEVLGALAMRCENELMWDPDEGDRTSEWFWEMISNMGLDKLDDWHFDIDDFEEIIGKFNARKYDKDGYGGPFYIEGFDRDMRKMELWYQMNYYIRSKYAMEM